MKIIALADTHEGLPGGRGMEAIGAALAMRQRGDQLLHSGDLVHSGTPERYKEACGALLSAAGNLFLAPGNHDYDPGDHETTAGLHFSETGERRFNEACRYLSAPRPGTFVLLAGTRTAVVTLDTCCKSGSVLDLARGRLGDVQLARLDGAIAIAGGQRLHLIVAMHHAPTSAPLSKLRQEMEELSDADAFLDRVWCRLPREREQLPLSITVVCGHTHGAFAEWTSPRGVPCVIYRLADAAGHGRDGVLQLELREEGWRRTDATKVSSDWTGMGRRAGA